MTKTTTAAAIAAPPCIVARDSGETTASRLLTVSAAESYSGLCRASIYNLLAAKKLAGKKFGTRTLVTRASLDALIESLPDFRARRGGGV